ncbi:MAG: kynureninase [Thermoanaerobaculia bacterium]
MPITPEALSQTPNALAPHYARFRVDERPGTGRLLLTGHSHQAWPDRSFEGQLRAWEDAAALADEKWVRAFAAAARVKDGFARLLGLPDRGSPDRFALAPNTHELLVRFLSALDLKSRPRLLTTDGEFHSIRRQLDRLREAGVDVVRVGSANPGTLAERLTAEIDDRVAAVLVSSVLFQSARIVPGLGRVLEAARRHGAELLVDVYHQLGAVPLSLTGEGLEDAYVVGGGYKYCQLGEGNCFLRVPRGRRARPVITGWFAEFDVLAAKGTSGEVLYGRGGARFAGATYDPTSHYRGASVFDFFDEMGLTPELLRAVSQHQVGFLARAFDELDVDPSRIRRDTGAPLEELGGFLVLETPHAEVLSRRLRRRGVLTDYRGDHLRLGPAPYLSDLQLCDGIACLDDAVRSLG